MQGEEIFETIPDKHDSVKEAGEKVKKLCNVDAKIPMKFIFHNPPTWYSCK